MWLDGLNKKHLSPVSGVRVEPGTFRLRSGAEGNCQQSEDHLSFPWHSQKWIWIQHYPSKRPQLLYPTTQCKTPQRLESLCRADVDLTIRCVWKLCQHSINVGRYIPWCPRITRYMYYEQKHSVFFRRQCKWNVSKKSWAELQPHKTLSDYRLIHI